MKTKIILLFLSNVLIISAILNAQVINQSEKDTIEHFFPSGYFIDTINPEADGTIHGNEFYKRRKLIASYTNSINSMQLWRLKEPKLFKEYPHEVYRFTWFGFFGNKHNPFTIRIENHNDTVYIVSKFISRDRNGETVLFVNDTVFLDNKAWLEFKTMIEDANFWEIPTIEKTSIVVMDGATWILEGKKNDLYHAVFRVSGKNKEIGNICLYLVELSTMKLKRKQFY
jgi:hypothetical protein